VQACFEADDADIMIVRNYRESPFHVVEPLPEIEFVLCVAPEHKLAQKRRVTLLELHEHVKLTINDTRSRIDLSGKPTADGTRVYYLGDFDSKKRAVLLGLGYGWMPLYMVEDELKDGRLVVVDFDNGSRYSFMPRFVTRSNRHFGKAGQLFKETLLAYMAHDWLTSQASMRSFAVPAEFGEHHEAFEARPIVEAASRKRARGPLSSARDGSAATPEERIDQ
jgi:DNA-binding transcriptional LysR family regulator